MNLNTLSLYLYAGLLNLGLLLVLIALSYLRPGAQLIRKSAYAIALLSCGLIVSGYGDSFPRWVTVIGTNMVLLAVSVVFYSGVAAFRAQRQPKPDWFGWGIVASSVLPFWYWGLVEPNGYYRSAVFSLWTAAIHARITYQFLGTLSRRTREYPNLLLTGLFGIFTLGMLARSLMFLLMDPAPEQVRAVNPTDWTTVFWYIVLASAIVACVIWVELSRPLKHPSGDLRQAYPIAGFVEYFRRRLILLWALLSVLTITGLSEAGLYYTQTYAMEEARLTRSAEVIAEAFGAQTKHTLTQVDTVLHAVRIFYNRTGSVVETEEFIDSLPFDQSIIDNVYLISSQGEILVPQGPGTKGVNLADREFFVRLKSATRDEAFVSSVERGRVTGKLSFRLARRLSNSDGSFAGVVFGNVKTDALSRYYGSVSGGAESVTTLMGITDKKIRARFPNLPDDGWQRVIDSPVWAALQESTTGVYQNVSNVDHIPRIFVYRQVEDFPLVMVTGFSRSDVWDSVYERLHLLVVGSVLVFAGVLTLAILLTIEIRRRNEQDQFLSMLSHELKTPLSTIGVSLGGNQIPESTKLRIGRAVGAMNSVIERCLQSGRLAHGRVDVAVGVCDIPAVVNDVRTSCSEAQRVFIEVGDVAPVRTDQQLFSVIVSNLIDNALKYGTADGIVQVRIEPVSQGGAPGILVEVSNLPGTAGMPDPKQVFRKYYRAPGARGKSGSGLGLHIAAGFAKKLGGRLRYLPTNEKVKFMLWIPA